jgi:hypothetical protein
MSAGVVHRRGAGGAQARGAAQHGAGGAVYLGQIRTRRDRRAHITEAPARRDGPALARRLRCCSGGGAAWRGTRIFMSILVLHTAGKRPHGWAQNAPAMGRAGACRAAARPGESNLPAHISKTPIRPDGSACARPLRGGSGFVGAVAHRFETNERKSA